MEDTNEMISTLFLMWGLNAYNNDKEVAERSFIHQLLTKKMVAFDTGIIVPLPLSLMLELGLEGNPGLSQVILAEIIKNCHISALPYTITSQDFANTFPFLFPNIHDVGFMEEYEEKWDSQKRPRQFSGDSDNMVDTPEYWKNLVKFAMIGYGGGVDNDSKG